MSTSNNIFNNFHTVIRDPHKKSLYIPKTEFINNSEFVPDIDLDAVFNTENINNHEIDFSKTYFMKSSKTPRSKFRESDKIQNHKITRKIEDATCVVVPDDFFKGQNPWGYGYTTQVYLNKTGLEETIRYLEHFDTQTFVQAQMNAHGNNNLRRYHFGKTETLVEILESGVKNKITALRNYCGSMSNSIFTLVDPASMCNYMMRDDFYKDYNKVLDNKEIAYCKSDTYTYEKLPLETYYNYKNIIITDSKLSEYLSSSIIDEESFTTLDQMLNSDNRSDISLAMNIMSSSNIIESRTNLVLLLTKYQSTFDRHGIKKDVYVKNMYSILEGSNNTSHKFWNIYVMHKCFSDEELVSYQQEFANNLVRQHVMRNVHTQVMNLDKITYKRPANEISN